VVVDAVGAAESSVGTIASAVGNGAKPLDLLGGALGGGKLLGGGAAAPGESCPGPLAIARGQAAPAEPARATPTAATSSQPKPPNTGALLKQLFR
jgi:hypothetical protein